MSAPKLSENTFYNLIDTLLHLDRDLWDRAVSLWTVNKEKFYDQARDIGLERPVAHTYWHAIEWGMEYGYPLQFNPGNEYFRRHPEHALDALAERI